MHTCNKHARMYLHLNQSQRSSIMILEWGFETYILCMALYIETYYTKCHKDINEHKIHFNIRYILSPMMIPTKYGILLTDMLTMSTWTSSLKCVYMYPQGLLCDNMLKNQRIHLYLKDDKIIIWTSKRENQRLARQLMATLDIILSKQRICDFVKTAFIAPMPIWYKFEDGTSVTTAKLQYCIKKTLNDQSPNAYKYYIYYKTLKRHHHIFALFLQTLCD